MRIEEIFHSDKISVGDVFIFENDDTVITTTVVNLIDDGFELACDQILEDFFQKEFSFNVINEATYQGRKVRLNKPFLTPDGPKKRSVYVKNAKGNVVKVNFGDKKLRIKKSNPKRRKSFRARHNCASPGPKWKARFWSCKFW